MVHPMIQKSATSLALGFIAICVATFAGLTSAHADIFIIESTAPGIAVKSHGGTDALGFASAVDLGYEMAESGLVERLATDLTAFHARVGANEAPASSPSTQQ